MSTTQNNQKPPHLLEYGVSGSFFLLTEYIPKNNGTYEVITSKGRVVESEYEKFLENHIWVSKNITPESNEIVIAWRFLK